MMLPNLHALRTLGALSVFFFHFYTLDRNYWSEIWGTPIGNGVKSILNQGHFGVNLFFVLSGFLISYSFFGKRQGKLLNQIVDFLKQRFLRIVPLYFLVVVFLFFIFPFLPFGAPTQHKFVHFLIFISNFDELWNGQLDTNNLLTITWSVSIEMQFYVLFAISLFFHSNRKVFLTFHSVLIGLAYLFVHFNWIDSKTCYYHSLPAFIDLSCGVIIYLYFEKIKNQFSKRIFYSYLVSGVVLFVLSVIHFNSAYLPIQYLMRSFGLGMILMGFTSINYGFLGNCKPLVWMSKYTYGIYLIHPIVLFFSVRFLDISALTQTFLGLILHLVISFSLTLFAAYFSYAWIEKPILDLRKR